MGPNRQKHCKLYRQHFPLNSLRLWKYCCGGFRIACPSKSVNKWIFRHVLLLVLSSTKNYSLEQDMICESLKACFNFVEFIWQEENDVRTIFWYSFLTFYDSQKWTRSLCQNIPISSIFVDIGSNWEVIFLFNSTKNLFLEKIQFVNFGFSLYFTLYLINHSSCSIQSIEMQS